MERDAVTAAPIDMSSPHQRTEITTLLGAWRDGDADAAARLAESIYPDLQRLAHHFLDSERPGHTLEPHALVNELWVRLLSGQPVAFQDRTHFLAVASKTMRRVLIDYARARNREKRGGIQQQVSLSALDGWGPAAYEDWIDLDTALTDLAQADPRSARVVEMKVFGGLQDDEIAAAVETSAITVKRDWQVARAWLLHRITARKPRP